jgi:hypothetical protein
LKPIGHISASAVTRLDTIRRSLPRERA